MYYIYTIIFEISEIKSFLKEIERADSRSKKNYNPAACGTKTTFTERQTR